ncbi:hypothetical protein F5146DRAFT_1143903 [Armillaria mellea]|nr:hypothetical protein F5146DRAFT_1143903 [Armillaria mellea]
MIPTILFYVSLFMYIQPVPSLLITVPTEPHPYINDSTSVLLSWSSGNPSRFFIAIERIFSPDVNVTSLIQLVENFMATRNVSVVFISAGQTFIEAIGASPTQVNINVMFASSEPFQVDKRPENSISLVLLRFTISQNH